MAASRWWAHAVFYQVYPRSYSDGNDDGEGDLIGLRERLDHLSRLGVDAIWLSPFYRSPMADGGYDVADPCDVDPRFGTLADFDAMTAAAHGRDIRVIVDLVPNHLSSQHPWFVSALAAGPGSAERARFWFLDGRGADGALPPNNWVSMFGGPAWTRVPDGQWYLHIFAAEQPDLNWANPQVPAEFDRIMRFWLDRGVDGFRIDVAHGMAKPAGLPDMDLSHGTGGAGERVPNDPRWDNDEVHTYLRGFRRTLDDYPERMAVGEVWVPDPERLARYVRADELHQTFNFNLLETDWGAATFRSAIEASLHAMRDVGAPSTWVLGNHDVVRQVTRYGGGRVGLARARAAALMIFALPGGVYVYNGDELGLPDVALPDDALRDPMWERTGHRVRGRDGERVPMPWSGQAAPWGFCASAEPWLPMPPDWGGLTVQAQDADPGSVLWLYRTALAARRATAEFGAAPLAWIDAPSGVLAFARGAVSVWLNAGASPVPVPAGRVLLSSAPPAGVPVSAAGVLQPDTAMWIVSEG